MKNVFRFIIGLFVFFILLALVGIAAIILSPLVIAGGILILIFILAGSVFALIVGFFAFIWYMSREEPKREKKTDYSIDQGKDV